MTIFLCFSRHGNGIFYYNNPRRFHKSCLRAALKLAANMIILGLKKTPRRDFYGRKIQMQIHALIQKLTMYTEIKQFFVEARVELENSSRVVKNIHLFTKQMFIIKTEFLILFLLIGHNLNINTLITIAEIFFNSLIFDFLVFFHITLREPYCG